MKYYFISFFLFFIAFVKPLVGQSQDIKPPVELIEDKQPKRWNMYVQNHSDIEYEAFLLVRGEGFRRSADRPVIKKIPPKSKVLMITLIPLKGVTPTYTKIFTYEEQLQSISKRKGASLEREEDHVNLLPVSPNQLTVFTEKDCEKCEYLINHLTKNRIRHRLLDVKKNSKVFDLMWSHLKDSVSGGVVVKLPVIMRRDKMYFDIFNMEHFIQNFEW